MFHPTYLYIKQHSGTRHLYFGKTTKDPLKYNGSGLYWTRHIKKHKSEIETLWYCLFTDQAECTKFAIMFSNQEDIVNSSIWLNLAIENGIDGSPKGRTVSMSGRANMSKAKKGKPLSELHKLSISASCKGRKLSLQHIEKTKNAHLGSKRSPETRAKIKEKRASQIIKKKTWTLQDPNGNLIITQGLKTFCTENHLGLSKLLETEKTEVPVNKGFSKGWKIVSVIRS